VRFRAKAVGQAAAPCGELPSATLVAYSREAPARPTSPPADSESMLGAWRGSDGVARRRRALETVRKVLTIRARKRARKHVPASRARKAGDKAQVEPGKAGDRSPGFAGSLYLSRKPSRLR